MYDIVLLQEVHIMATDIPFWSKKWNGLFFATCGDNCSKGCITMFRNSPNIQSKSVVTDVDGRYIINECVVNGKPLIVANIYAPNSDTPHFFEDRSISLQIEQFSERSLIIMGDFNLVLDPMQDRSGEKDYNVESYKVLKKIIQQWDLCDIWESQKPDKNNV